MIKNFKIIIEYDGTRYHGWQRQKNDITIQGEIEKALGIMTAKHIVVNGSGRTDAGVHARGQAANFRCKTDLSPGVFQKGLNNLLPEDIVIRDCRQVEDTFHARYDVKSKIYHYKIYNHPVPAAINRSYVWSIRKQLNIIAMRSAVSYIIGSQDFKAFEGAGSPRAQTTRHVMAADLIESDARLLTFRIEADGFLRFMVRNIVGTLVDVGLGKTSPVEIQQILESRDRTKAGATAPPHGLCLMEVKY
ncbi:MAG: tRNA pseudouridine(38-40) synthase TruA [Desulfobacterales bacterium]|jgi:tRNA pseudouridine38-40 synthase